MSNTTDLNIVLNQGNIIKEIHNVKKQMMEINQHFLNYHIKEKEREERKTVKQSEKSYDLNVSNKKQDREQRKSQGSKREKKKDHNIDIKV